MRQPFVQAIALLLLLSCGCGPKAAREQASAPEPTPAPPARAVEKAVLATIPLPAFGTAIALSPDGRRAYVTVQGGIVVVDTGAGRVARTIATGDTPYAITLSADGSRGYAVDLGQQELLILDLVGGRVSGRIALGPPSRPALGPGVGLAPNGGTAYATIGRPEGQGYDMLRIVDTASGDTSQRGLDFHPGPLVVARDGLLWIAGCVGRCSDGSLRIIDPSAIGTIAKIDLASLPGAIAMSPGGRRVVVANGRAGSVSVFDAPTRSLVAVIPVGAEPAGVAASPDGQRVYATTLQSGELVAIDVATSRVVATAQLGQSPRAIAVSPDGLRAYVTHSTPVVSVVDLTRLFP